MRQRRNSAGEGRGRAKFCRFWPCEWLGVESFSAATAGSMRQRASSITQSAFIGFLITIRAPKIETVGSTERSRDGRVESGDGPEQTYCADDAVQTTTNGLLAGLGTAPQEAELSVSILAERRFGPQ